MPPAEGVQALPFWPTGAQRHSIRFGAAELRQFGTADTDALFAIRNHASVRRFVQNPAPLDHGAHVAWVRQHLAPGGPLLLFIVRLGGEAIGFALIKRLSADAAELGVMFREPDAHAAMAAKTAALMLHLACERLAFAWTVTYVNLAHARALALNRGLGLTVADSDKPGELCFRTPAATVLADPRYQRIMARLQPRLQFGLAHGQWQEAAG